MALALPDAPTLVAEYLAAAGLGLTEGSNLFAADEIPDAVSVPGVYVEASGGPPPTAFFGSAGSEHVMQVSILVRGEKEKKPEGYALSREIADALQKASIPPFWSVLLRDSQPVYLGRDDHDAPGWSLGVDCRFTS